MTSIALISTGISKFYLVFKFTIKIACFVFERRADIVNADRFCYFFGGLCMNLTLVIPSLNRLSGDGLPPLLVPSLNKLMRFGRFSAVTAEASELYGRYLWQGSLLAEAKKAAGIAEHSAAVLVSPVWQQMGMHHVNMVGGQDIGIGLDEAEALCRGLEDLYRDLGWRFYLVRPDLWLLVLENMLDWQVPPVLDMLGQMDGSVKAEGSDAVQWLQWQTEMQMWLHGHDVNRRRQAAKQPEINGVWLWTDCCGQASSQSVLGSDSVWAQFYPGTKLDAPYDWSAWQAVLSENGGKFSDGLLFLDDLAATAHTADVWTYKDILEQWEQRWFAPLWQALSDGSVQQLKLVTDGEAGGELLVKAKAGRAFWKRQKQFAGRLGG